MTEDKHAALRQNIRFLGEILGETLKEQEGDLFYQHIESVRQLAKQARKGDDAAKTQLHQTLSELPADESRQIARAFTQFLQLANVAEQYHRVRRTRTYGDQLEQQPHGRKTFAGYIKEASAQGFTKQQLIECLQDLSIELVLTAHPTEATRRSLILKYENIASALDTLDRQDISSNEREESVSQIRQNILAAWHTDEIRSKRPTPIDEAKWVLAVVEHKLWHALPKFLRQIDQVLEQSVGESLPIDAHPIRFASWVGGDRDGNPTVTAEITHQVSYLSRWMAADLYLRDLEKLRWELSVTRSNQALRDYSGDEENPYRSVLRDVYNRMKLTRQWANAQLTNEPINGVPYVHVEQVLEPLLMCYHSLVEVGLTGLANGNLLDMIRRLNSFGLSLLPLDVRQDSERHEDVMAAVCEQLGLGDYRSWDEAQRIAFLEQELNSDRPLIPRNFNCSDDVQEVINTFRVIADLPSDSLGAYVISMAQRPSDVLTVELLQREFGVKKPLRVVPLFETLADLRNGYDTVTQLLDVEWYNRRVKQELQGEMEIMIGYSDSAKDAGLMAASWMQYQAQERFTQLAKQHGIRLTLFHGRGGSVGRGGAPTHQALLSQAPGSVGGRLRITEQGEMIQQKFGLVGLAQRTLEIYLTATMDATLNPPVSPKQEWREQMDFLAEVAGQSYRTRVKADEDLVDYYNQVTPVNELGRLAIGSRPARRNKKAGLTSLRAIPWVFAWTQTRLLVPAWLGVGDALTAAINRGELERLQTMASDWPFFKSVMNMVEMVLAKVEPGIARQYEQSLLTEPRLQSVGDDLLDRLERVRNSVPKVLRHEKLLQDNPMIAGLIALRNPYVDPINCLQIEMLERFRQIDENDPNYEDIERALLVTIAGIAAGMRNTG